MIDLWYARPTMVGGKAWGAPTSILDLARIRLPARRFLRGTPASLALLDFALIFALALALRLHGLAAKPFWIDEVVTKARAALPLPGLIAASFSHHHLPTYFLLLHQVAPGGSAWMLRLPSAIGGAFAAAIGGLVGQRLSGRMAGLMSGLMLAAAPVMVQFGQDARPYALELACLMLSLWGLVTLACDAEAAGGSWRNGVRAWSALLLGMVGGLALIGDAGPFLLAANLAAWPIARGLAGAGRRRFLRRWIAGQAAVLLAVAPLYVAMSRAIDGDYMVAFAWIPPLDALRAWRVAADVYLLRGANIDSLHLLPAGLPGVALVVPLLAVAGFVALRRQPAARIVMVLAVLSLPVLLVLAEPSRPLWLPRYLLWSGAAFLILAGVGAAWLARRWSGAAPAAAAALLLVNLLPFYRGETVPRWDHAAASLAPALAAGADVFLDDHGVPMMLRAYLPGGDAALPRSKVLFQLSQAEAHLRAGGTVIAVHGPTGQGWTSRTAGFKARVAVLGTPVGETRIGHEIVLIRFNPPPGPTPGPLEADVRPNP